MNNRRPAVCSSSHDKTIRFWDFETSKEFQVLNGHAEWVAGITFSPFNNGRYLCSGSGDKTIRLWDVETSKSLHVFNGHTGGVWCVEFSPLQSNTSNDNKSNSVGVIGGNGYSICSGSYDNAIRSWDVETTKELTVLKGHEGCVRSVKYLQYETNTLCSGSDDKSIRLWDIRSNKEIHVFKGHTSNVNDIKCSPFVNNSDKATINSIIICSGSYDNTIRFWDIRTNKQLHVIKGNENEDSGIFSLQFSPLKNKERGNKNTDDCVCSVKAGKSKMLIDTFLILLTLMQMHFLHYIKSNSTWYFCCIWKQGHNQSKSYLFMLSFKDERDKKKNICNQVNRSTTTTDIKENKVMISTTNWIVIEHKKKVSL
ncbi:WD-40 repeat protein [Reticulomyxa filosa]|uniref:WD-40 repeat protein n=1 Tax=Reticulomyxa filosa TaxID=46433 RepID=X6MU95_RETFI|nr:WD-40 repeat protein [Reticulomyxa filosa]|eukprot:ETO16695.1 WD-40 repeat protein [Reticulomyxa filosa]